MINDYNLVFVRRPFVTLAAVIVRKGQERTRAAITMIFDSFNMTKSRTLEVPRNDKIKKNAPILEQNTRQAGWKHAPVVRVKNRNVLQKHIKQGLEQYILLRILQRKGRRPYHVSLAHATCATSTKMYNVDCRRLPSRNRTSNLKILSTLNGCLYAWLSEEQHHTPINKK